MKLQLKILVFSISLLVGFQHVQATSVIGGEITWTCIPNGKYIFNMNIYKECASAPFPYVNQSIFYQGGTILMKPDINHYNSLGGGNASPKGPTGCQLKCDTPAQAGAIQVLHFVSDPITLNGVPPASGWVFTWSACCRSADNLLPNSSGRDSITLRSIMYPYKGKNANRCYDSSPNFYLLPPITICRGYNFVGNYTASDKDLDKLVFSYAEPWSNPNTPVTFQNGFSYTKPLPDSNQHPINIVPSLNSQTGEFRFSIYSGSSRDSYATTMRVDAYRDGIKIASVFRDLPFIGLNCPMLPGIGFPNNPPSAQINGKSAINYIDSVKAGEKVTLSFQSIESDIIFTDPNDPSTATLQNNYLSPSGLMFSNDFTDPTACKTATIAPCATLTPAPTLNINNNRLELKNKGTVNTVFEWQTDCNHLDFFGNTDAKTHTFVMETYDDHCDIRGVIYPSINITVLPAPPVIHVNGDTLSVDSAQWVRWYYNDTLIPNAVSNTLVMNLFGKYTVRSSNHSCPDSANYFYANTSIAEEAFAEKVKIYPNPFTDGFTIETPVLEEGVEIVLLDVNGRQVSTIQQGNSGKFQISGTEDFTSGIYFVRIRSGGKLLYKKMIKL